jgi:xanthine dehydrogenase accessory factor
MTTAYHHAQDVLAFANDAYDQGEDCALICVTDINGGAMRARGALMAVRASGAVAGYISNGCIDADIITQALAAMTAKKNRTLRYGEGSPYKDLVLPCGGLIDLCVVARPDKDAVKAALGKLTARQKTGLDFGEFQMSYMPRLRLRIAGRGAAMTALASQALATGFDVILQSPEVDMKANLPVTHFDHLTDPSHVPPSGDDPWTALVLMFHDHSWEEALLLQALQGPAFYIGAMGSRKTHANRREFLSADQIEKKRGPIGLIPSLRDANLLALSTLAEIVSVAQEKGRL